MKIGMGGDNCLTWRFFMIQRAERSIKLIEAQTPDVYAGPRPAASRVNNASTRLYYLPTALITYM